MLREQFSKSILPTQGLSKEHASIETIRAFGNAMNFLSDANKFPSTHINNLSAFVKQVIKNRNIRIVIAKDGEQSSSFNLSVSENPELQRRRKQLQILDARLVVPQNFNDLLRENPAEALSTMICAFSLIEDAYVGRINGTSLSSQNIDKAIAYQAEILSRMKDMDKKLPFTGQQGKILALFPSGIRKLQIENLLYPTPEHYSSKLMESAFRRMKDTFVISTDSVSTYVQQKDLLNGTAKHLTVIEDDTDGLVQLSLAERIDGEGRSYFVRNNIDGRFVVGKTQILRDVAKMLNKKLSPEMYDSKGNKSLNNRRRKFTSTIIVGLPEGSVLLANAVASERKSPFVNFTKTQKPTDPVSIEFQEKHRRMTKEQYLHVKLKAGDRVILVDDEVSSADSLIEVYKKMKENGIEVVGIATVTEVINYNGREKIMKETGLSLISLVKIKLS